MTNASQEEMLDDALTIRDKLVKREFTYLGTTHEVYIPESHRLITKAELTATLMALEEAKAHISSMQRAKREAVKEATEGLAGTIIRQEKALRLIRTDHVALMREHRHLKAAIKNPLKFIYLALLGRSIRNEEEARAKETQNILKTAEELLKKDATHV
jgi:hypothetical protein